MQKDIAMKIVTQAADLGVNSLKFNWRGESTLNPHFKEILSYAKRLAGGSTFIERLTNSNFKFGHNRSDVFEGLACQTKVKVSFDSFEKDVFETQRAGGKHAITMKNIDLFYNHPDRIKSNTEIVIQAVRTQLNKDEDIYGNVKKRWPSANVSIRDVVAGRLEGDIDDLEVKTRDTNNRQSCLQAHVRIIFNSEGVASPCCPSIAEQLQIGDIRTHSLREIFNSQAANQIRRDLKSGKAFELDPCKNCSSFESYKNFKPSWGS